MGEGRGLDSLSVFTLFGVADITERQFRVLSSEVQGGNTVRV